MIWDGDGFARLDRDQTLKDWDHYQNRIASHYGFDDNQRKLAEATYRRYAGYLRGFPNAARVRPLIFTEDDVDGVIDLLEEYRRGLGDASREPVVLFATERA